MKSVIAFSAWIRSRRRLSDESRASASTVCETREAHQNLRARMQTQCQSLHAFAPWAQQESRRWNFSIINWILCARAAQQTTGGWSRSRVDSLPPPPPLGDSQLLFAHQQLRNASSCVRNGISISHAASESLFFCMRDINAEICSLKPRALHKKSSSEKCCVNNQTSSFSRSKLRLEPREINLRFWCHAIRKIIEFLMMFF